MSEEYEALMRFHLLMSDKDLSDYRYAAVDEDGTLVCFERKPTITKTNRPTIAWNNADNEPEVNQYIEIETISLPERWEDTLIEL